MIVRTRYHVEEIDERRNNEMVSIVRESPVEASGAKIVFDRGPDLFLLLRHKSESLRCIGFFSNGQLVGFAVMLRRIVMVNSEPRRIRYFGSLVVHPAARGRNFLFPMTNRLFKNEDDGDSHGYFVIMQGNKTALRLLNRFHPDYPFVPHARKIGQWQTKAIFLITGIPHYRQYRVRTAKIEDFSAIAALLHKEYKNRLFGPVITEDSLRHDIETLPGLSVENYYLAFSGNEIIGVCCAWDMSQVKRNRVNSYNRKMKWIRRLVNLLSTLIGYPGLPAEGEAFREVTVTEYAVKERDPRVLRSLLSAVYRDYRKKKYHMMLFGFPVGDPLERACRRFLSMSLKSEIYQFSESQATNVAFDHQMLPYIDMTLI